jgi:2-polyprenyl-6-methoxyphenol hydroxylase-like FAD-dependent oxidoreductase
MTLPEQTEVLIVGGGPAGSLLGCLLARRGIDVVVVEKQVDLERDFRGETIAARSTVTLRQLGFGPALDAHGYLETDSVTITSEGRQIFHVDYHSFPIGAVPIDIPQPALIGIFQQAAAHLPTFHYVSGTTLTGLLESDGAVRGGVFRTRDGGRAQVRARLTVGADGRFSKVRKSAGLAANIQPMERDFLSFKLPRPPEWGRRAELVIDRDRHLVILPTFPNFLRVGHNLPKRGLGELRKAGFDAFRDGICEIDPRLRPLVAEHLRSWDDTGFLEIFTAELDEWTRDGLLLIGDASHTCTPILGQGVNLAIQDAVGVTPIIASALHRLSGDDVVPASEFAAFVADRRAKKGAVTRFQRIQEAQLAVRSPLKVFARRVKFKTLNAFPLKYRMFDRVLNAPQPIDEVDIELAQQTAPSLTATGTSSDTTATRG